ncbi:MAG: gluconokinase [Hyphomicrobiaceae bacterium]
MTGRPAPDRPAPDLTRSHSGPGQATLIVLMGVSGCGKTTTGRRLANLLGWPFRDADSFHPPGNIAKMSRGIPLTDEDRWPWLHAIAAWLDECRVAGRSGIVSCSALKRAYREVLLAGRSEVRLVFLKGPKELIGPRLERRKGHFMPASLLDSQFAALEPPDADECPLIVSVAMPPKKVAARIVARLGLAAGPAG